MSIERVDHDGPRQEGIIRVPHHSHPLERNNPLRIYKNYGGNWRCDNCNTEHQSSQYPFHCNECSYDLCESCGTGVTLRDVHVHQLFNVKVAQVQNQNWTCSVCKSGGIQMGQTNALHCSLCHFYMCCFCASEMNHPIHEHPLKIVNTDIIYPHTNGNWGCDVCGRTSRFNERFSRHCAASCEFDVCNTCVKEYHVPCHNHPLVKADPNVVYGRFSGNWRCDNCGNVSSSPTMMDNKPWHCMQCEYDLCNNCMQQICPDLGSQFDVTGPSRGSRGMSTNAAIISPHLERLNHQMDEPQEPVHMSEKGRAVVPNTESADNGDECIICLENPKNATLIHGDTGHLCCCWSCAQVLKMRGDPCPICRQPIDHVIKQFKA